MSGTPTRRRGTGPRGQRRCHTPTAPRAYGSGAARGAQSPYASSAYRTSPAPQAETFVYPVPSPTAADGRPVPAEAAFMPYWAAVEQTSIVLSPDNSGAVSYT